MNDPKGIIVTNGQAVVIEGDEFIDDKKNSVPSRRIKPKRLSGLVREPEAPYEPKPRPTSGQGYYDRILRDTLG